MENLGFIWVRGNGYHWRGVHDFAHDLKSRRVASLRYETYIQYISGHSLTRSAFDRMAMN